MADACAGIGSAFVNTLLVVGSALVLVMILGAMCAYVLARFRFRGRTVIRYLVVAGLTFPVFLAVVPLFFILRQLGVLNTLPGLIISYATYAYPFQNHATMEPMNATALYTPERCEVWTPTQNGEAALAATAEASGLPPSK